MPSTFFNQLPDTETKAAYLQKKKDTDTPLKKEKLVLELNIFDSTSYNVLNADAQRVIYDYVRHQNPLTNVRPDFQYEALVTKREAIATSVARHDAALANIIPATFRFLTDEEKTAQAQELYFAFYVFSAQYELDVKEDRKQNLNERAAQIHKCTKLLNALRSTIDIQDPDAERKRVFDDSERPVKYLGLTIVAPVLTEIMLGLITTGGTIKSFRELNILRLYWVWAKSLIGSILAYLCATEAQETLAIPSPVTGGLSWSLYFTWFGVNLYLLTKQSLPSDKTTEEEAAHTANERFWGQVKKRKWRMTNDFIWGWANLACFFWLIGDGMLGYWGDAVTAILLGMDAAISLIQWHEEAADYATKIDRYTRDIIILNRKIRADAGEDTDVFDDNAEKADLKAIQTAIRVLEQRISETRDNAVIDSLRGELNEQIEKQNTLKVLTIDRNRLVRTKQLAEKEWDYKTESLLYDCVYSFTLLVAFGTLCTFLFPPGAVPIALIALSNLIAIIGAGMCLLFTVIYSGMSANIDIKQSRHAELYAKDEHKRLLTKFKRLNLELTQSPDDLHKPRLENQMRNVYLEIQWLKPQSAHQRKLIDFQKKSLLISTVTNLIIPVVVLAALLLLPFGLNIAVIAIGLITIKLMGWYLEGEVPSKKIWQKGYGVELSHTGKPSIKAMDDNCLYLYYEDNLYDFCFIPDYQQIKAGKLQFIDTAFKLPDAYLEDNKLYITIPTDGLSLEYSVNMPNGGGVTANITIQELNQGNPKLSLDKFTEDQLKNPDIKSALLAIITTRQHIQSHGMHCAYKNTLNTMETFKLADEALGDHARAIRARLDNKTNPGKLDAEERKLMRAIASEKGLDFSSPYFDEKKYDQFKTTVLSSQNNQAQSRLFSRTGQDAGTGSTDERRLDFGVSND